MTDGERIAAALAVSGSLHWLALSGWASEPPSPSPGDETVVIDLSAADVGVSLAAPIVLEQEAPAPPQAPNAAADRRREALVGYLDQVSESVHARRAASGAGRRLIGNALVRVVIDGDGRFAAVALIRGSGDPILDADAVRAVRAASGTVPRPRILGDGALAITLAVKYQFGL